MSPGPVTLQLAYVPEQPNAPITSLYLYVANKVGVTASPGVRLAPGSFYLLDADTGKYLLPEHLSSTAWGSHLPKHVVVELGDDALQVRRRSPGSSDASIAVLKKHLEAKWDRYRRERQITQFALPGAARGNVPRKVAYRPGVRD